MAPTDAPSFAPTSAPTAAATSRIPVVGPETFQFPPTDQVTPVAVPDANVPVINLPAQPGDPAVVPQGGGAPIAQVDQPTPDKPSYGEQWWANLQQQYKQFEEYGDPWIPPLETGTKIFGGTASAGLILAGARQMAWLPRFDREELARMIQLIRQAPTAVNQHARNSALRMYARLQQVPWDIPQYLAQQGFQGVAELGGAAAAGIANGVYNTVNMCRTMNRRDAYNDYHPGDEELQDLRID